MDELTTQQRLVLDHKYRSFEMSKLTGDHLDSKASTLLQSASFIIALIGALKIPDVFTSPSGWALLGLGVAFLAFAGMLLLALLAWRPSTVNLPAPQDWDFLFDRYVYEDAEGCFVQILADLNDATDTSIDRNAAKARFVTWSVWLFMVQIAGLLLLALTA